MADLSKIQTGDTLRIDLRVYGIGSESVLAYMDGGESIHVQGKALATAEHVPAPRIFKRGDWVRTRPEIDSQTGGIVTWVMSGGSTVRVHWPSNISEERLTADLEPDEAPE